MTYIALTPLDLALTALLILLNGALSWAFRLGLERTLVVTSARMVVQLGLIGFVLKWIFAQTSPAWTAALALVMISVAGWEVLNRQQQRAGTYRTLALGTGTLMTVGLLATTFAMVGVIGPQPWYEARFLLPILGMVLGNALTGISLVLDTITSTTVRERAAIEARLALGATRREALEEPLRHGLKTGLMPILNAMAASGLVSLPGMMTGQILAGADPVDAAMYQIMIMFLIAGATALSVVLAGLGAIELLTDQRHRLRLDRIETRKRI